MNRIPSHIAIIMDGNRRYAKEHGKDVREGHLEGKERIRDVLNWCMKAGVRTLTVYAFSTENFVRYERTAPYGSTVLRTLSLRRIFLRGVLSASS